MLFRLPREGITLEFVYSWVQATILNLYITFPILLGLDYFSNELHSVLPEHAHPLFPYLTSKACLSTLNVLLGLGIVRKANNHLSQFMLNNFTRDSWNYGEEIVIVTGAGGGIGEAVVRAVASSSATVIALDLHPPKTPLRKYSAKFKPDLLTVISAECPFL